jgi:hypothetical protein
MGKHRGPMGGNSPKWALGRKLFYQFSGTQWFMFMIHSGPVCGNSPKWASTVVRWAETAQNGHSVENFFVSAQIREFFSAMIVYYPKEVLLPNGNQNSCSNGKLFYQNFEIIEWNY